MTNAVIWDGIGSALVAGILSGLVVLGGIKWTQRLADGSEKKRAKRRAADVLIESTMNLKDALLSRQGEAGHFSLWEMRLQLSTSRPALGESAAFEEAQSFYERCSHYREWVRDHGGALDDLQDREAEEFESALRSHAGIVIALLQGELDRNRTSEQSRPAYPQLSWFQPPRY